MQRFMTHSCRSVKSPYAIYNGKPRKRRIISCPPGRGHPRYFYLTWSARCGASPMCGSWPCTACSRSPCSTRHVCVRPIFFGCVHRRRRFQLSGKQCDDPPRGLVHKRFRSHLAKCLLAPDQELTPEGRDLVRVRATVLDTKELRWWLLGFGEQVTLLAPTRLRDRMRETVASMASHCGMSPTSVARDKA
jgi:hypothetical protein